MTWNTNKNLSSFPIGFHESLTQLPEGDKRVLTLYLGNANGLWAIKAIRKQYSLFRAIIRLRGSPVQRQVLDTMLFRTKIVATSDPDNFNLMVNIERNGVKDIWRSWQDDPQKDFGK